MSEDQKAQTHAQQARRHLADGRLMEALSAARLAVEAEPESADAQALLGVALCRAGALDQGIEVLRAALALDPACRVTRRNLFLALQHAEQVAAAERAALASGSSQGRPSPCPVAGAPTYRTDDPDAWSLGNVLGVAFVPQRFFRMQRGCTSMGKPVLYAVLSAAMANLLILGGSLVADLVAHWPLSAAAGYWALAVVRSALTAGQSVSVAMAVVLLMAGFLHLAVAALGGRAGFGSTTRAVAYGFVTPFVLVSVPIGLLYMTQMNPAGRIVQGLPAMAGLWGSVLAAVGIRALHGLPTGRATIAVVLADLALLAVGMSAKLALLRAAGL